MKDLYEAVRQRSSDINEHLAYMHDLCVDLDAQIVVELGVRSGMSTVAFLAAMEQTGGMLWSCDINQPRVPEEISEHPQWTFMWGDDLELVAAAPECDVLFIDTSHHYAQTLAELSAYAPKTRKVILLHDTQLEWPDGAPGWPTFPVRKAALDFQASYDGWDWSEFTHNNGLGVLTRKASDG